MFRRFRRVLMFSALLAVFGSGFVWYDWLHSLKGNSDSSFAVSASNKEDKLQTRVNVLLIGTDQRLEEKKYNTDSLILASVDPQAQRISLLSIPRDTRIHLLGYGEQKINAVASLASLEALQKTVSDLLGVPVSGYILTNFAGFKQIIDTLGSITVNVEKDMYYETGDKVDGYINLHKGVQRLDGSQALQYARFRYDALADISRTARQQAVLKAVAKEMFQLSTVPKLPVLIPQLLKAVQTNLSSLEILKLAKVAAGFDSSQVISQTLPGSFMDLDGVSYWKVDPQDAQQVMGRLYEGITTDRVIDNTPVDLLKPVAPSKPIPKVPGNSMDPNGQKSPGHESSTDGVEVQINWPAGPDGAA
ncbi:MAG: LCP family protein [Desulfitobacteriaceae bacterium]